MSQSGNDNQLVPPCFLWINQYFLKLNFVMTCIMSIIFVFFKVYLFYRPEFMGFNLSDFFRKNDHLFIIITMFLSPHKFHGRWRVAKRAAFIRFCSNRTFGFLLLFVHFWPWYGGGGGSCTSIISSPCHWLDGSRWGICSDWLKLWNTDGIPKYYDGIIYTEYLYC